jgi:hypothetical protein
MSRNGSRKSSRAWLIGGSFFSVVLLAFGVMQGVGLLAHKRHRNHSVVTAPVRSVDISSGGGSVSVVGTTGRNVVIDAAVSEGLFAATNQVAVQGDRLVVRSSCPPLFNPFCKVDYTVQMPQALPLRIHSSGGGIYVDGVTGDLDLASSGGGVHVTGSRGRLLLRSSGGGIGATETLSTTADASSSGGGIRLAFSQPPNLVRAGSSGGGITIQLPHTSDTYRVDIGSSGGSSHNDVRTDPTSTRLIHARSSGGSVRVQYTAP